MESAPRSGSPALRQGLIFGIILAVIEIAFSFLGGYLGSVLLIDIVSLAIFLVIGFLAGRRASTKTGRLGTGVLAGFLSGLIGTIISSILPFILTLTNLNAAVQSYQKAASQAGIKGVTYTPALVIQTIVLQLVFSIVLGSLLTLAGGAIGGYIGKGRAQIPQSQYEESMFVPPSSPPPPPAE
jgi:hypothetical protein